MELTYVEIAYEWFKESNDRELRKNLGPISMKYILQNIIDERTSDQNDDADSCSIETLPRQKTEISNADSSDEQKSLLVGLSKCTVKTSMIKQPQIRSSRGRGSILTGKHTQKLDKQFGKRIIRDIMVGQLSQREKAIIKRAFSLGIDYFFTERKNLLDKKNKHQRSHKCTNKCPNMSQNDENKYPCVTKNEVQWDFSFIGGELEQHPFHDIATKY